MAAGAVPDGVVAFVCSQYVSEPVLWLEVPY